MNLLYSLTYQSLISTITKPSRITNQTATLIENIFISQPNGFVSGILISDISDNFPLFILKRNLFTKKSSQQNTNVKYHLINDSAITNLRQSLLCLDLNRITGSDNCTTAMLTIWKNDDHFWNKYSLLNVTSTTAICFSFSERYF